MDTPIEENEEPIEIQGLPDEPPIEGGILSSSPETQLETRENLDSLPYDESPIEGDCTFPFPNTLLINSAISSR